MIKTGNKVVKTETITNGGKSYIKTTLDNKMVKMSYAGLAKDVKISKPKEEPKKKAPEKDESKKGFFNKG